jgi:beta-mannosidase
VPDEPSLDAAMGGAPIVTHHPQWKARVPRDSGAGWDFEDVRDHYLTTIFGVDPVALRYSDTSRYLALSRVITGEVMAATFAEWRHLGSRCHGGLVWFYQDLWPGAGWGVVDSQGRPKAAYYYLRRAFAPTALFAIDEGLNGLWLHAVNDGPRDLAARLSVRAYRRGETVIATGATDVTVPARGGVGVATDRLFDGFRDITWAYRFGPREHDLVVANLETPDGLRLAQAVWLPDMSASSTRSDLGLTATARRRTDGEWELLLRTRCFARAVAIDADGFLPVDNYLHLAPGEERRVVLRNQLPIPQDRVGGAVRALNGDVPVSIVPEA